MSHHRRVVSTVFLALVVAATGALVLLLGDRRLRAWPGPRRRPRSARPPSLWPTSWRPTPRLDQRQIRMVGGGLRLDRRRGRPLRHRHQRSHLRRDRLRLHQGAVVPGPSRPSCHRPTTAESDEFGWSVAISGTTVVVGAPGHTYSLGGAYVFSDASGTWTQQAELAQSTGIAGESNVKFGYFGGDLGLDRHGGGRRVRPTAPSTPTPAPLAPGPPGPSSPPLTAPSSDEFGWSMALSHFDPGRECREARLERGRLRLHRRRRDLDLPDRAARL